MNGADFRKQRSRIEALTNKWVQAAGFGWWDIDIVYSRARDDEHPECAGKTTSLWEYSQATIEFFLPVTSSLDDDQLEQTFVHELCHLPMSGMRVEDNDSSMKIFEWAVDDYAKHMLWASKNVKKDKS